MIYGSPAYGVFMDEVGYSKELDGAECTVEMLLLDGSTTYPKMTIDGICPFTHWIRVRKNNKLLHFIPEDVFLIY